MLGLKSGGGKVYQKSKDHIQQDQKPCFGQQGFYSSYIGCIDICGFFKRIDVHNETDYRFTLPHLWNDKGFTVSAAPELR